METGQRKSADGQVIIPRKPTPEDCRNDASARAPIVQGPPPDLLTPQVPPDLLDPPSSTADGDDIL
jgi:hypothetical protein